MQSQYEKGLITDDERRQELIEIWTQATAEVGKEMEDNFPRINPVWMMVHSGARGNLMQIRQIAGMRGLVANPKGEIIPRPIKSNFAKAYLYLSTSSQHTVRVRVLQIPRYVPLTQVT